MPDMGHIDHHLSQWNFECPSFGPDVASAFKESEL
jgi:hypothetical protein